MRTFHLTYLQGQSQVLVRPAPERGDWLERKFVSQAVKLVRSAQLVRSGRSVKQVRTGALSDSQLNMIEGKKDTAYVPVVPRRLKGRPLVACTAA